jgi:hypothetical protein
MVFKNLDDSEILSRDFSGLRTPAASIDLIDLCNLDGLYTLQSYFTKELPNPDGWIIPGTKITDTFWPLFVEWIIKNPIFH